MARRVTVVAVGDDADDMVGAEPATDIVGLACPVTPDTYTRWRATTLGRITDRLESERLRESLPPLEGLKVLDVGCGDGALSLWLHQQGAQVTGVDMSAEMLAAARDRFAEAGADIPLHQADAADLPFEDNAFDLITAVTILCFVREPQPVFNEVFRVLNPGGQFIIGELGRLSFWAVWRWRRSKSPALYAVTRPKSG